MRSGPDPTARLTALFGVGSTTEAGADAPAGAAVEPPAVPSQDSGFGPPEATGWVPPGPLGAQLRALARSRVPPALRGARWSLDRRALLALVALCLLGVAFAAFLALRGRAHEVALTSGAPGPSAATSAGAERPAVPGLSPLPTAVATPQVLVDVEGRVRRPGLVRLPRGARLDAALRAAGGPLPGADTSGLNLARVLVDGEQVRVAIPGPDPVGPAAGAGTAAPTGGTGVAPPGGIRTAGGSLDLNAATLGDLDALPGVGPVTAQHILDWRTQHGRFTAVDQLQEVTGIGPATYAKLAPLVHV